MNWSAIGNSLIDALRERFPVEKLDFKSLVLKKTVPVHRWSWAYFLGGLALLFFIVQIISGLLLLVYYQPTVSDAHASVHYLTAHVPYGAIVRNLHAWSASLMIFFVFAHFVTTFAMKAFARPREVTWLAGVVLLLLAVAFGFTGYLLPWNQIAVNATKVVLQSIEQAGTLLPAAISHLPGLLRVAIQGEPSVGQATLSRFFALHVLVLPLVFVLVLGLHLLSVQLHGMSQGVDETPQRQERFFPNFMLRDLMVWTVAFLAVVVLAHCLPFDAFIPAALTEPFNPLGSTPEGIKPEWYFFAVYYPMEMLPFWVIMIGMTALTAGLFFVPWIFRGTSRKVMRALAFAVAFYLVVITVFGHDIYLLVKGGQ
ncbi:MAG: cytochrome b [Armatimonadota bacterium]